MSAALKDAFYAFASYGKGQMLQQEMDTKNFLKCFQDAGLVSKTLTSTDLDIIHTKVKDKGSRKINFIQFCAALDEISMKKGIARDVMESKIEAAQPSSASATRTEYVRYHDDKSTYTGVYAKGGPTNVDKAKAFGLAGLLDRSEADVRGVKIRG